MQGDSYSIPIEISTGENMFAIDISELDELEIIIGNIRKTLNKGTITFNDGSTAIYKQNKTSWDIYPLYGYNSPKVLLDHPLKKDTPNSDVICIACKDGKLYLSYQRYNFSEWTELASSTTASLVERIGFINKYTIGIMWR